MRRTHYYAIVLTLVQLFRNNPWYSNKEWNSPRARYRRVWSKDEISHCRTYRLVRKREKMSTTRITYSHSCYVPWHFRFYVIWFCTIWRNTRGNKALFLHKRKHKSGVFQVIFNGCRDDFSVTIKCVTYFSTGGLGSMPRTLTLHVWLIWRNIVFKKI